MINIYTDGACAPTNPGHGGFAYVSVHPDGTVHTYSECYHKTTNNRMELMAVVRVLENYSGLRIHIHSDSTYVVTPISTGSIKKRSIEQLMKKPNHDLWIRIKELLTSDVTCSWVRGHNGNKYNELADKISYDVIDEKENRLIDHGYNK